MKRFGIFAFFILCLLAFSQLTLAQKDKSAEKQPYQKIIITKEYDREGNLIGYDSTFIAYEEEEILQNKDTGAKSENEETGETFPERNPAYAQNDDKVFNEPFDHFNYFLDKPLENFDDFVNETFKEFEEFNKKIWAGTPFEGDILDDNFGNDLVDTDWIGDFFDNLEDALEQSGTSGFDRPNTNSPHDDRDMEEKMEELMDDNADEKTEKNIKKEPQDEMQDNEDEILGEPQIDSLRYDNFKPQFYKEEDKTKKTKKNTKPKVYSL